MLIDDIKLLGFVKNQNAKATPLTGGVSCEIFLVEDGNDCFVAKRALEKLKVKTEWLANTSRNIYEQRYLKYIGEHFPQWAPKLLASSETHRLFTMEFLPESYQDWKKRLMKGEASTNTAKTIGKALGSIHSLSWNDEHLRQTFEAQDNFEELRLSPYFHPLLTRYTTLAPRILSLCERIRTRQLCLIHGDFSPKNILVGSPQKDDIKIIDCEVACFGDPAFDVAFLLHHLILKYWHLAQEAYLELANAFFESYKSMLSNEQRQELNEVHTAETCLFLILARLDGKSPVEYLSAEEKTDIRERTLSLIHSSELSVSELFSGVKQHEYS